MRTGGFTPRNLEWSHRVVGYPACNARRLFALGGRARARCVYDCAGRLREQRPASARLAGPGANGGPDRFVGARAAPCSVQSRIRSVPGARRHHDATGREPRSSGRIGDPARTGRTSRRRASDLSRAQLGVDHAEPADPCRIDSAAVRPRACDLDRIRGNRRERTRRHARFERAGDEDSPPRTIRAASSSASRWARSSRSRRE